MRRYLIDSTPLAGYLQGRPRFVALLSPLITTHEATSILVYGGITEYLLGLPDYRRRHQHLRRLLQAVYPYFLTCAVMDRYARIRRALRPPPGQGLMGDVDTLIAATAIERDLTLVTTDTDFQRVPGLRLQLPPRHAEPR